MSADHGRCPSCDADMNGGSIWEHFMRESGDPVEADRIAAMYGATKSEGQWGRAVALYDRDLDRTVAFRCPDCGHEWPR